MFVAKEADFRVLQTHHVGCHDTEGYASLHPRLRATRFARAFDLKGRAAGFLTPMNISIALSPAALGVDKKECKKMLW